MNQRNPYLKHVKRLEFSVTHRCRSRCAHCALGPDRLDGELLPEDAAAALEAVDRACALESVLTFGGEPLLCVPTVCAVHQQAEDRGIPRRQLITSGCFTHDKALREHTADRLEASGVNEILLSVDAFHTEHLPIAEQYAFARALCEAGLGSVTVLHPAWLKGPESRDPYDAKTRACLRRFEPLRLPVGRETAFFRAETPGFTSPIISRGRRWMPAFSAARLPIPSAWTPPHPWRWTRTAACECAALSSEICTGRRWPIYWEAIIPTGSPSCAPCLSRVSLA